MTPAAGSARSPGRRVAASELELGALAQPCSDGAGSGPEPRRAAGRRRAGRGKRAEKSTVAAGPAGEAAAVEVAAEAEVPAAEEEEVAAEAEAEAGRAVASSARNRP